MAFSPEQSAGIQGSFGIAGLAGGIAGSLETSEGASQKYAAQKQIARLQMLADQQRRQQMETDARRQMLQTVRNAQQAGAIGLSNAVAQGAQFGSGAAAGQGQVSAQSAYSNLGTSQSLQIGEQMFNINEQIDAQKIAEADAETKMAQGQGLSSMLGALGKSGSAFTNIFSLLPLGA